MVAIMKSRPLMFSTISRRRHRFRSIGLALSMFYVALSSSYLVVGCDSYTANPPSKQHSSSGYTIQPMTWEYKSRYDIGYEVATPTAGEKDNDNDQEHPILLLNGFGVGSFHQHRLIAELLKDDEENDSKSGLPKRTVYCLDYLGQGRSWPKDCRDGTSEDEKDLQYSANTWCEQIIDFIEQVVEGNNKNDVKVHLVGNSVGGHLAAHVAQRRPDLVASICLLNPTPVWGSKLPGWNGHLPAPAIPKA
ncbi:unnamed protein product [Pseudo-nitzschia multistriata]|uniref:AB hydrolase-1 domain-containing protein n=1 Tax=Pseudo-nitzschia multistriata TaxID=183589 RepID=A0A448Z374_9STRA|nr:unnamed protein product [Pseudo-nitzschia multistriata]